MYDREADVILEGADDIGELAESIRSDLRTPRRMVMDPNQLVAIRRRVDRHISKTYERHIKLPTEAPRPKLECWMELN